MFEVFTLDGVSLGNARDLLRQKLSLLLDNTPEMPTDKEFALSTDLIKQPEHYVMFEGKKYNIDASVTMGFEKSHFYGRHPVHKISGFHNPQDDSVITRQFEIRVDIEFINEVLISWEKITDELAIGKNAKMSFIRQGLFAF